MPRTDVSRCLDCGLVFDDQEDEDVRHSLETGHWILTTFSDSEE